MDDIVFYTADEWTAVYLNGKLERVGDSYLADEWLQQRCGVNHRYDNAFMRGGTQRDGVAQTLAEVEEYEHEQESKRQELDELRRRIKELETELSS